MKHIEGNLKVTDWLCTGANYLVFHTFIRVGYMTVVIHVGYCERYVGCSVMGGCLRGTR